MAKQYIEGKVQVAFKPDVPMSEVEKIISNYTHTKTFTDKDFDPNSEEREDRVLARAYLISTGQRKETEVLEDLKNKYSSVIEYAELVATRKLIKPKPHKKGE